jgi:radical SAM protein with 4Fe4S-binding SPASM domain
MGRTSYVKRVRSDRAGIWKNGRPLLTWLDIELTERCNYDCLHCSVNLPAGDSEAAGRELTAVEIKSVFEEAVSLGCLTVRLTGGEPLLREDFEEIYVAARTLGLKVMLFTNASLITPRLADLFKALPPLERIEISFYGMTPDSYEAVTRRSGSHAAARRGLRLLVGNGIPFVLKSAVLPPNKAEMGEFEAWAATLTGLGKPAYSMLFELRSRRDEAKNDLIRSLRPDPREFVRLASGWGDAHVRGLQRFVARFAGAYGERLFTCLSGCGRSSLDAYGRIQYCLQLRHPEVVYDLKQGSLKQALTEFIPRVQTIESNRPDYLARCGRCFLKGLCQQCPARSWSEHGTLDTPVEYLCSITHAQGVAIGVLEEGEKAWTVSDWPSRIVRLGVLLKNGAGDAGPSA